MRWFFIKVLVVISIIIGCTKEAPKTTIPIVTTFNAISITSNSVVLGGNISDDGGAPITERGLFIGLGSDPISTGTKKAYSLGEDNPFSGRVSNLQFNTTYYVKAYATNEKGIGYGNLISFTTLSTFATVLIDSVKQITATSITIGCNITSDGGDKIITKGVCWSTNQNPTISGDHTEDGYDSESFISLITSLTPLTTYYIRAYAINKAGTAYSDQIKIITQEAVPTIPSKKKISIYNTNGILTENVFYYWSINNKNWELSEKEEYYYNNLGKLVQRINYYWKNSLQKWVNEEKYTYADYIYKKNWISIIYRWSPTNERWSEYLKYENYIFSGNYITVQCYKKGTYDWESFKSYKYELTKNGEGLIIQQIISAFQDYAYAYIRESKQNYVYDSKGNIIDSIYANWSDLWGWSDPGYYAHFTCDSNMNPITKLVYTWNSDLSKYINTSKIIYSYDSKGNQLEYIEYSI